MSDPHPRPDWGWWEWGSGRPPVWGGRRDGRQRVEPGKTRRHEREKHTQRQTYTRRERQGLIGGKEREEKGRGETEKRDRRGVERDRTSDVRVVSLGRSDWVQSRPRSVFRNSLPCLPHRGTIRGNWWGSSGWDGSSMTPWVKRLLLQLRVCRQFCTQVPEPRCHTSRS